MGIFEKGLLKGFDLFSRPFSFFVGDKKNKSTIFGGFISIFIIGASIYYFYYLMNLYFSGKISPKITSSFQIESNNSTINIDENFFFMEMMINGQPLKQYEKQVNKVFLTYTVTYEQYYKNGTYLETILALSECTDQQFYGYQCLDQKNFLQNIDIYNNPILQYSSNYAIQISPCDPNKISNCASPTEIYNLIFQSQNYFQLYTKIQQYNTSEGKYQSGYKSEYIYFDPQIMSYTRIDLIVATTKLTQGLIFQQSQTNETVYDYQRVDTYFSQNGIEQRMQISGFAYLVYELNQIHNYIQIEEPMVTEILAQFVSIFNTLLLIGFLAKLVADSHIIDDINNMLLTEYYKKTAFILIKSQEVKDSQKKQSKKINKIKNLDEKIEISNSNNVINSTLDAQKCRLILDCQNKINKTNFSEQLSKYIKLGFFDRIINFFCQIFGRAHKVQSKKDASQDKIFFRNLMKQSLKRINIFEVYKDLIKMKMAIKLILTKEQYAAIQFCGTELLLDEQQNEQVCQKDIAFSRKEETVQQNNQQQQSKQKSSFKLKSIEQKFINTLMSPYSSQIYSGFKRQKKQLSRFKNSKRLHSLQSTQSKDDSQSFSSNLPPQQVKQITGDIDKNIECNSQRDQKDQEMQRLQFDQSVNSNNNFNLINNISLNQTASQSVKNESNQNDETGSVQNFQFFGNSQEVNIIGASTFESSKNNDNQDAYKNAAAIDSQEAKSIPHLVQMDLIEQDQTEQEKFLQQFLKKMNTREREDISYIDLQIYQSLIISDQISLLNSEFKKNIDLGLEKQVEQDYNQSLSKMLNNLYKKQNSSQNQNQ
ncbi:hypothetical protein ABPG74_008333 [Tetrahymena malaccensis]